MKIANIHIENFRNISRADVDFGKINVLTGKNSSGKSNILFAISNSLRIDPDFSFDFNDNVVTHSQGISRTTISTKIDGLLTKNIFYQPGGDNLFFAPESMRFENVIAKKSLASIKHKLSYTGDFSKVESESDDNSRDFNVEETEFASSKFYEHLENRVVYEMDFDEKVIATDGDKQLVKKLQQKQLDYEDKYFALFKNYSDKIFSWVGDKDFSSSRIYKFVTETYDSDDYELVMSRYNHRNDELTSFARTPFAKARFIYLLVDVFKDVQQYSLFKEDLKMYTDGIVTDVKINTEGSLGVKGEIWIDSKNNPKEISSISAGTAVLIYFILLKNWLQLSYSSQSFAKPEVMVFDEVDSIIHPSLMEGFCEILNKISESLQLFISTHSPHFIDCFEKRDVYWLRDSTSDSVERTAPNIMSYQNIVDKLEKNSSFFKKEMNSKLFIDGLLDSVFPNIDE